MSRRTAYRGTAGLLSAALVALGVVAIVRTLAAGGGPGALGLVVGVGLVVVGTLRIWLLRKAG